MLTYVQFGKFWVITQLQLFYSLGLYEIFSCIKSDLHMFISLNTHECEAMALQASGPSSLSTT